MTERIAEVGYINSEKKHALISVYEPALLNARKDSVQIAIKLRSELNNFLNAHGVRFN